MARGKRAEPNLWSAGELVAVGPTPLNWDPLRLRGRLLSPFRRAFVQLVTSVEKRGLQTFDNRSAPTALFVKFVRVPSDKPSRKGLTDRSGRRLNRSAVCLVF